MILYLKCFLKFNRDKKLRKEVLFIGLFCIISVVNAQTEDNNLSVGLNFVKNEYTGDLGSDILNFSNPWYPAIGLSITTYITRSIDFGLQGSFGKYGYYKNAADQFGGFKFDGSLFIHYKLNNGHILNANSKLSPFISLGFGFASYSTNPKLDASVTAISTQGVDFIMPFGIGIKYQLFNSISVQYQYLYNTTNMDNHDGNKGLNANSTSGSDAFGQHIIGLIYTFNMPKFYKCRCEYN